MNISFRYKSILLVIFSCTACVPTIFQTPMPTSTATLLPTSTSTQVLITTDTTTPRPTATELKIPTIIPTETLQPTDEVSPQIFIGLPYSALDKYGCGGYTIYTMDYDPSSGKGLNYWEKYQTIPIPEGLSYTTRDGRRALDYCTKVGFPITWQLEEGQVTQNRDDGVLDILITKGIGKGLTITFGHINPDLDSTKDGDQKLEVGSIIHFGDLIAYTGRRGIPVGSDSSTQTGVIGTHGYLPQQELMLIGPDGQPNILYDK